MACRARNCVYSSWEVGVQRILRRLRRRVNARLFRDANAIAVLQPAQLLELFDALQIALRKGGKFQQSLAAENVQPQMLQMSRVDRALPVSYPGDGRAGKIQCIPVEIEDGLH